MIPPADPFRVLDWVQLLAAAGAVLVSAELLFLHRQFADTGFFGWPQTGRLVDGRRFPWAGRWIHHIMRSQGITLAAALRLVAALLLLAPGLARPAGLESGLLAVVLVTSLLMVQRLPYGLEGSDQLAAITFAGLLLARLFPHSERVAVAVLWFLALQAALAYVVAGVVKLREPGWRNGSMLQAVLATEFYGHAPLAAWLRTPAAARAAIWGVIVFELAFPLVFFVPAPWVLALLGTAFLFHAALAVAMGLNAFVWAFLATYPAIFFCATTGRN